MIERFQEIHERVLAEGSITDKVQCPSCGSTDVGWVGGDSGGMGDYYDMYACTPCNRGSKSVHVFLVPVSKEDYDNAHGIIGGSSAMIVNGGGEE